MARNYVALPYEYREEMAELSDAEFGRLVRALLKYSETGEPIRFSGNERFYAKRVMTYEDKIRESYDKTVAARREAGEKSGEARRNKREQKETKTNKNEQTETEQSKNDNKNTNKNTNIKETISNEIVKKTAPRFSPPSIDEVKAYIAEAKLAMDADAFFDHYSSVGWKVANKPMKDWKAACRNWARREKEFKRSKEPERTKASSFDTDEFFNMALEASRYIYQQRGPERLFTCLESHDKRNGNTNRL